MTSAHDSCRSDPVLARTPSRTPPLPCLGLPRPSPRPWPPYGPNAHPPLAVASPTAPPQQLGLWFLQFALCLRPEQIDATTDFVAGRRALREWYAMQYVYLWTMLIVMLCIIILCKWHLSLLYIWFIPATVLVYAIAVHTMPYWMQGISACPPHTGAAVELAGIFTVLVFLFLFVLARACFMCARTPTGSRARSLPALRACRCSPPAARGSPPPPPRPPPCRQVSVPVCS